MTSVKWLSGLCVAKFELMISEKGPVIFVEYSTLESNEVLQIWGVLEAERIFNEQVAERQRKEEALRKQQLENEQYIQYLTEEVSQIWILIART